MRKVLQYGSDRRSAGFQGFTLLELLIALALLAIIASFGIPALDRTMARAKLVGSARETAELMRLARSTAVKTGAPAGVTHDIDGDQLGRARMLVAFQDTGIADPNQYVPDPNANGRTDPNEDRELGRAYAGPGVEFAGPGDLEASSVTHASSFARENVDEEGTVIFRPDGSADALGAFRFRDHRGNALEARVDTAATGRVLVRKYSLDATAPPLSPPPGEPEPGWLQANESTGWDWN